LIRVAHGREVKLRAQLEDVATKVADNKPDFRIVIDWVVFGEYPERGPALFLLVSVHSLTGIPSPLEDWQVTVRYPGAAEKRLEVFRISPSVPVAMPTLGRQINSGEQIIDQTFPKAVPGHDAKRGWLFAFVDRNPPDGTTYGISCRDNRGKTYSHLHLADGEPPEGTKLGHLPGITVVPIQSEPNKKQKRRNVYERATHLLNLGNELGVRLVTSEEEWSKWKADFENFKTGYTVTLAPLLPAHEQTHLAFVRYDVRPYAKQFNAQHGDGWHSLMAFLDKLQALSERYAS
jgi:hypothetical protein